MFDMSITPVDVLYAFTVPSNELARFTDETTITELPGMYDKPGDIVRDMLPFSVGVGVRTTALVV
jgi:hypothetical protein